MFARAWYFRICLKPIETWTFVFGSFQENQPGLCLFCKTGSKAFQPFVRSSLFARKKLWQNFSRISQGSGNDILLHHAAGGLDLTFCEESRWNRGHHQDPATTKSRCRIMVMSAEARRFRLVRFRKVLCRLRKQRRIASRVCMSCGAELDTATCSSGTLVESSIDIHHLQTSNNVERQAKNCDIYPLVLR